MNHTHRMLRAVLKSQYHASLAMLSEAIERCPPGEWLSTNHKNAFWQVSYHALFFAHLYLQQDKAAFRCWKQHRGEGDGIAGDPYTQVQVSSTGTSVIGWSITPWTRWISTAPKVDSVGIACPSWSTNSSISGISNIMPRN